MDVRCNSLEELRENIDLIDRKIVALLAERGRFVNRAAAFKKSTDDVRHLNESNKSLQKLS